MRNGFLIRIAWTHGKRNHNTFIQRRYFTLPTIVYVCFCNCFLDWRRNFSAIGNFCKNDVGDGVFDRLGFKSCSRLRLRIGRNNGNFDTLSVDSTLNNLSFSHSVSLNELQTLRVRVVLIVVLSSFEAIVLDVLSTEYLPDMAIYLIPFYFL